MYDVITIGSSLVDVFVKSSHFTVTEDAQNQMLCQFYGEKMEVDDFQIHTGGGASNTAVGFARLGFNVGVVTELGSDNLGKIIADDFHVEYVATNLVITEKQEKTGGSVILVDAQGGRSVLVHRGASSHIDPSDIPSSHLRHAEWIHLSSISGNEETLRTIFATLKGTKKLSWNPGNNELNLLARKAIDITQIPCQILLLNKEEWEKIAHLQDAAKKCIAEIVVTNGKHGGVMFYKGSERAYTSTSATSIDDTGAGDAFGVGYVAARIKKATYEEAIAMGTKNAQSVIKYIGAKKGLLYTEQLFSS